MHDERLDDIHICGFKRTGPTGIKWICVRPQHGNKELPSPITEDHHLFIRNTKEEPDEADDGALR